MPSHVSLRAAGRADDREVTLVVDAQPHIEGAGVHLRRALGSRALPLLDPFLMLDEFHSDKPEDYELGFPSHPHRGFETVTYMLARRGRAPRQPRQPRRTSAPAARSG